MYRSREARIETTTICNYNCIMCPRELLKRKQETMSLENFEIILNKLKSYSWIDLITLSGYGEPFTDKTIMEKIKMTKERGYKIHIVTNGSLINPEVISKLADYNIEEIRFSVYGISRSVYKSVMGLDRLVRVTSIINMFLEWRNNTKVILEYIVLKENVDEVEAWKEYWINKVDVVEIWKPHGWAIGYGNFRLLNKKGRSSCGRPFKSPYQIQVNGDVIVCCFDINNKLLLGNLYKESLKNILEGQALKEIRHKHSMLQFNHLLCNSCDQLQSRKDACIFTNAMTIEKRINKTSSGFEDLKEDFHE